MISRASHTLFQLFLISLLSGLTAHAQPADELTELRALVQKLQARVEALEARQQSAASATPPPAVANPPAITTAAPPNLPASAQPVSTPPSSTPPSSTQPASGPSINLAFDGYYGYNFNSPIGRANLLRAYDVSSNSFSLNQASLVFENAPDPDHGKRLGARLDLQFGQATQTLQGNSVNEPRPDIYRTVFQAYGTYVAPAAHGLTIDFGKWASSLGLEGNYTKDQINYSRSYWFNYLPFYHMGVRANLKVSDALSFNYWVVNGTNQTEAFNGFKDELFGFNLTPTKNINWTANYYLGQEHPDVTYYPGGAPAGLNNLPTLQGTPFQSIPNPPTGRTHIFDSYVTWNASPKLTFALEGDYVVNRLLRSSAPSVTAGGALYTRYQLLPKFALAGRAEYLSDGGGLFSGNTQALKETTITADYKLDEHFLMRAEFRRDFSNHPYFLTSTSGLLKKEQNTATLGLVWWYGQKQGSW